MLSLTKVSISCNILYGGFYRGRGDLTIMFGCRRVLVLYNQWNASEEVQMDRDFGSYAGKQQVLNTQNIKIAQGISGSVKDKGSIG